MSPAALDGRIDRWLFHSGTLRQAEMRRALFERDVEGIDDVLFGYDVRVQTITDRPMPPKDQQWHAPMPTDR